MTRLEKLKNVSTISFLGSLISHIASDQSGPKNHDFGSKTKILTWLEKLKKVPKLVLFRRRSGILPGRVLSPETQISDRK